MPAPCPVCADRPAARLLRRGAATALDYTLLAAPLALLALARLRSAHPPAPPKATATVRAAVALGVSLPCAGLVAWAEARGGSPGKRLLGLRVRAADGGPPGYGRTLVRALAKTALPWELGHQAVWDLNGGATGRGTALAAAAYTALGAQAAAALRGRGRTYADLAAGTAVVCRRHPGDPRAPGRPVPQDGQPEDGQHQDGENEGGENRWRGAAGAH